MHIISQGFASLRLTRSWTVVAGTATTSPTLHATTTLTPGLTLTRPTPGSAPSLGHTTTTHVSYCCNTVRRSYWLYCQHPRTAAKYCDELVCLSVCLLRHVRRE